MNQGNLVLSLSFVINRLPLTSNLAYLSLRRKNGSSFRTLTKDGKIWKQVVADAVQSAVHKSNFPMDMDEQGVNLALLGYTMEISIHQNMTKKSIWRRDAESGAKLLIDSMREVIGLDDRYATKVTISKSLSLADQTSVIVEFFPGGKKDNEL